MRLFGFVFAFGFVACGVLATPSVAAANVTSVTTGEGTATRSSAVIVSSHIASHRDAIGAGVVVAVGPYGVRIVTAKHVADAGDVTVWIEGTPYPAEIVRTFPHRDLAVVDALIPPERARSIRAAAMGRLAVPGEAIDIWGETDAGPRLERGTIVAPRAAYGDPHGAPLLGFACASCRRGDSGAGIFGSDGQLLGVLTARLHTVDDRTVMLVAEPIDPAIFATAPVAVISEPLRSP